MSEYIVLLNKFLANQIVFYTKLHNLHWYVNGCSFFTLHARYEEMYDHTAQVIDDVAERLLMLSTAAVAALKDVLSLADIQERPACAIKDTESIQVVLTDLEKLKNDAQQIVSLAAQDGDDGTADQFTGYIREYQKTMWLLKSCLAD